MVWSMSVGLRRVAGLLVLSSDQLVLAPEVLVIFSFSDAAQLGGFYFRPFDAFLTLSTNCFPRVSCALLSANKCLDVGICIK